LPIRQDGEFARKVLYRSLAYAARRLGEISDSVSAVDDAMKWDIRGARPFETWTRSALPRPRGDREGRSQAA